MGPSHISTILVLLCAITHAFELAELVPQIFSPKRAAYQGGWALALSGADCPAAAPVSCPTASGLINPTCCPKGQTCKGSNWPYCCPTNSDCVSVVQNLPVCANSTWNMYSLSKTQYFCCEPGQIGILPIRGYTGICGYADQAIAASLIATVASQIGGVSGVTLSGTTQSVAATTSTSTKTTTSSLKGGGFTTITSVVTQTAAGVTTSGASVKKKVILGTGAIVGIVIGGLLLIAIVLLILLLLRSKKRKNQAPQVNSQGYQYGPTGAPMYSAAPAPYQSPAPEYKTPAVGYGQQQQQGGVEQGVDQGKHGGGYVRTQEGFQQPGQQGYGTPTPPPLQQQGPYGVPPVEAPSQWERRVEIGSGK